MLPYKVILINKRTEAEAHVASFRYKDDADMFATDVVRKAQWSNPQMWHTYRIETEE